MLVLHVWFGLPIPGELPVSVMYGCRMRLWDPNLLGFGEVFGGYLVLYFGDIVGVFRWYWGMIGDNQKKHLLLLHLGS